MARRSSDVPPEPGYTGARTGEDGRIHRRAANGELIAYTPDEYGVRKDDGHGLVKPVSSSGGLLFLAVLASLFAGGVAYGLARIAIDGTWEILGDIWWTIPVGVLVPLVAWTSYAKERRAEKLRTVRNLPRPLG
ncbi:hypothetical protein [Arthrobacter sp. H16F315]|uniref:hypothetical protein n=1 Tax=Arthrobacter sp. H16F315 TaxID=2955314 RepID=UPI00209750DD|nr:hypothetical protein [Arthrobacter sp. H16F315]MDD1476752.1 hypothetical protein [Arthrobacter sp. H16F315]